MNGRLIDLNVPSANGHSPQASPEKLLHGFALHKSQGGGPFVLPMPEDSRDPASRDAGEGWLAFVRSSELVFAHRRLTPFEMLGLMH